MSVMIVAALALMPLFAKDNAPLKRLDEASAVLSEIMAAPDKGFRKTCWEMRTVS